MQWIDDFLDWMFGAWGGFLSVLYMLVGTSGILLTVVSMLFWADGQPEAVTSFIISLYLVGSCIIPLVIFFFVNKSNNTSSLEENLECYRKEYIKVRDANAVFINVMTDLKVELVHKNQTINELNQKNTNMINDLKQLKSVVKTINKKYN